MLRDLDVGISNTGELIGTIVLEGVQIGAERRFMQPDRYNARAYGIDGLTGRETAVEFHTNPPTFGIDRIDELIKDEGAIPQVLERWSKQIYPTLAQRLALQ